MEDLSQLEKFLQSQTSEGSQQGEGSFTLAREKALLKLANFQLPFDGAWSVKLFQSAIASGAKREFSVVLGKRVSMFEFDIEKEWNLDELRESFFNPEPSGIRHLDHLLSALWAVGVSDKKAFQLTIPGCHDSLVWDGGNLTTLPAEAEQENVKLVVTHAEAGKNFLSEVLSAARINNEISTALKDYCFTSPIPLLVDARRFDALQNCPEYGWNESSFPIALSFLEDQQLPTITVPQGTFLPIKNFKNRKLMDGAGLESITKKVMRAVKPLDKTGLAALVSVNAVLRNQGENQAYLWELRQRSSRCFWIQDGVAVQRQSFPIEACSVSVACFLNADGLENDLSGFYLADERIRNVRLLEAGELLVDTLKTISRVSSGEIREHNKSRYQKIGNTTLIVGIGLLGFGNILAGAVGAILGTFGIFARFAERAEERKLLRDLGIDLNRFTQEWVARYAKTR